MMIPAIYKRGPSARLPIRMAVKHFVYAILLIAVCAGSGLALSPEELNTCFINAARAAKPSVVNIIIYRMQERGGEKTFAKVGYASGTIISKNGHVVTNHHVVKRGNYYQIILHDGTECETVRFDDGRHYIADIKSDIALLQIEESELLDLKPINWGSPVELSEGEWVIAIGNPYGLRQSITCGIVSSTGRSDIGFADIEDFIQTDVPINPGNSGGPLINLGGEFVGMNTAIRTVSGGYQGISFAIPRRIVRQVSAELVKYGRVRRGWLGFIASEKRLNRKGEKKIVQVQSVLKNSPAEQAGIKKGDLIREINGRRIDSLGGLITEVSNKPVSSKITISVSRGGHLVRCLLALREKHQYRHLKRGLTELLSRYGIELDENSQNEALVSYLSPMSAGYQSGLKRGDMIVSCNGSRITGLDDFISVFARARYGLHSLRIVRGSRSFSITFAEE